MKRNFILLLLLSFATTFSFTSCSNLEDDTPSPDSTLTEAKARELFQKYGVPYNPYNTTELRSIIADEAIDDSQPVETPEQLEMVLKCITSQFKVNPNINTESLRSEVGASLLMTSSEYFDPDEPVGPSVSISGTGSSGTMTVYVHPKLIAVTGSSFEPDWALVKHFLKYIHGGGSATLSEPGPGEDGDPIINFSANGLMVITGPKHFKFPIYVSSEGFYNLNTGEGQLTRF